MQYENFSRYLREKYSTRLHIAEQIIDKLKYNNQQIVPLTYGCKTQSCPLGSYSNKNYKELEPYFNECVLAAERIKDKKGSERDRQICYENFILAKKLERIKKPIRPNVSLNKKPQDDENDQATDADVDSSIDYWDSRSCRSHQQQDKSSKNTNERIYQYLNSIDMGMVRDTMPLPKPRNAKHFSICILPRTDSGSVNLKDNGSKVLSRGRQTAFKKEVLYHENDRRN